MVAPCTACFLTHTKAQNYMNEYSQLGATVQQGLAAAGLQYRGRVAVRHPLDVLVNDVGVDRIKERISRPLAGMKVACYYGCQLVRPYATFDDRYDPMTMDQLLRAAGAETVDWPLKTRCCGGTLTGIGEEGGQNLSYALLREARKRGADAIATACSLCQLNLECYQDRVKHRFGEDVAIPVAYFTQLLGRAMGIPDQQLGLRRMLVSLQPMAASV
jgi:heterodisulfide reductase subunit B